MFSRLCIANVLWCVALGLCLAGCAARPRYSPDVAEAIRLEPMRRMESESLILYYPTRRKAQAERTLAELERCASALRSHIGIPARRKVPIVLPELPFNNAYVSPGVAGGELNAVIPTAHTFDFAELGIAPDAGSIGCHELVHAVQAEEAHGFQNFLFNVFGDALTPQLGLDAWFWEGLAVYYEGRLLQGSGRPNSPYWRGLLAAGVAGQHIAGGDLNAQKRSFFAGNHYLLGEAFIGYLAARYGEEKLWQLVNVQSRSVFVPLGINLRFWQVYDQQLSTLLDDFDDALALTYPSRQREPLQTTLGGLGTHTRWALSASGVQALVSSDLDQVLRLTVSDPRGKVLYAQNLNDLAPPRRLGALNVSNVTGLSVSSDGRTVMFVATQPGMTRNESRLVRVDVAKRELLVLVPDVRAMGAALSPDGRHYLMIRPDGDRHDLVERNLATGQERVVVRSAPGTFFGGVRYAPNGDRLAASVLEQRRFRVWLFDAHSGQRLQVAPGAESRQWEPAWVDDDRLVFEGEVEGRQQILLADLRTGRSVAVTNAPYLAARPQVVGGRLRFLNREGWRWTLDEVALPQPSMKASSMAPVADASMPVVVQPASAALSDEPASSFDNLWYPQGRAVVVQAVGFSTVLGLTATGGDRLGQHSWGVSGLVQPDAGLWGGSVTYVNMQLAPLVLQMGVGQVDLRQTSKDRSALDPERRERTAFVAATRSFWGNPLSLAFIYTELRRDPQLLGVPQTVRLGGPELSAMFAGVDGSPYAGLSHAIVFAARAAYFPASLSSLPTSDILDLGATIVLATPLPLSRRHTLQLKVGGRDLAGSNLDLLQVGGVLNGAALYERPGSKLGDSLLLPPTMQFAESLRGYETFPLLGKRVALATATYRYPVILDVGSASTLWILPSLFVRQLDLELFGSAATLGDQKLHAAAGASAALSFSLGLFNFDLQYQFSKRFRDDEALSHLVMLGL